MNDLPNDLARPENLAEDAILSAHLGEIYRQPPGGLLNEFATLIRQTRQRQQQPSTPNVEQPTVGAAAQPLWSERDCVLITYADQIRQPAAGSPLQALCQFLLDYQLTSCFSSVHLLPFCPWTSDDGFSVVDYLQVDPSSGSWDDIAALGRETELMFDLVLNHCSQAHAWFQKFLNSETPYDRFFHAVDPATDLSQVVRPRSLPLLTPFETTRGTQHVWTTFSADQVDLNYAEPQVLLEMARTLVEYAVRGARIIRLDAIAFLWKEPGTSCLHARQTHAIVKLLRRIVDLAVPGTLLLTETNVPHKENVSYFGDGDEAHMVYQFSLPPLLLDAIANSDTSVISQWLATLQPPKPETTFFNFTASHDGIGVRPLEGLVSEARCQALVQRVLNHKGAVSMRNQADGSQSPYELNITYFDAVTDPQRPAAERVKRFLATQGIMLAIQGLPAVYFQSLIGAPSDHRGRAEKGQNRAINRRKYDRQVLDQLLAPGKASERPESAMPLVFAQYQRLLRIRRSLPAFHPNASQRVLELDGEGLLGFVRGESLPGETKATGGPLTVLCNLSEQPRQVLRQQLPNHSDWDYLTSRDCGTTRAITLAPFDLLWLGSRPS
ncbi:sugar phosphorylase [Planctomycetaceae bacterium SH139]